MEPKWRRRILFYLKLITRLSIPRRPGSASRRALSCQEEGDYNILLDKKKTPSPLLFPLLPVFSLTLSLCGHPFPLSPQAPQATHTLTDLFLCPACDYNT